MTADRQADVRRISDALFDNAERFSCPEAEAVARLLDWADPGTGEAFIASHAEGDDEGDDHFDQTNGPSR